MDAGPTRTAVACARQRALHLQLDGEPKIFRDEPAAELVASLPVAAGAPDPMSESAKLGRSHFLTRARYTEDALATSRAVSGVKQYVVLGAGLDTFALRSDGDVVVFEVDRPEMLTWKEARLRELGWEFPACLRLVHMDFETDSLGDRLSSAGLRTDVPTFVSWLGVSMYLTRDAIRSTLATIAGLSATVELVMTYCRSPERLDGIDRERALNVIEAIEKWGETFVTPLEPEEAEELLREAGFSVTHFGPPEASMYFEDRTDGMRPQFWEAIVHGRISDATRSV